MSREKKSTQKISPFLTFSIKNVYFFLKIWIRSSHISWWTNIFDYLAASLPFANLEDKTQKTVLLFDSLDPYFSKVFVSCVFIYVGHHQHCRYYGFAQFNKHVPLIIERPLLSISALHTITSIYSIIFSHPFVEEKLLFIIFSIYQYEQHKPKWKH